MVVSVTLIGKLGLLIGFDDQLPVRIIRSFCQCVNEIALGEKEVGTGSWSCLLLVESIFLFLFEWMNDVVKKEKML